MPSPLWSLLALLLQPQAPPGPEDLVVFAAADLPVLFRLAGDRPVPFSGCFSRPISFAGDPKAGVLYVLDGPAPGADDRARLWRLEADGRALIVARPKLESTDQNLGLDGQGRVLIADGPGGLLRLEADGAFTTLIKGESGELKRLACAAAAPGGGLFAASKYLATAKGKYSQGALFRLDDSRIPAGVEPVALNLEPGAPAHQTLWRSPAQILVDGAGRLLLVDAGDPDADLLGGILCFHPDNRMEDLTFKTPGGRSGPLRHPTGIAAWTRDQWLVADPAMYAGPGGKGGLFLLGADGRRDRLWRFGPRCRPMGVALLRGVKPPPPPPPRPFSDFAGVHAGGPVRVAAAKGLRQEATGMTVAGQFIQTGYKQIPLDPAAAAEEIGRFARGARWIVGPAGTLVFAEAGADPEEEGPGVCRGTADLFHNWILFSATSRGRTRTDPAKSFVRGVLVPAGERAVQAHVFYHRADGQGLLQGEFVQELRLNNPPAPPLPQPVEPAGSYEAGAPGDFRFLSWTVEQISGRPGSPSYGLYTERRPLPRPQAETGVQAMFRGSTWRIAPDGQIQVEAPLGKFTGTVAPVGDERVLAFMGQAPGALWCLMHGRLEGRPGGGLTVWLALSYAKGKEQVQAEFRLDLERR